MAAARRSAWASVISAADAYLALAVVAVVLLSAMQDGGPAAGESEDVAVLASSSSPGGGAGGGRGFVVGRPCDEIYVVGEGETLHTISDKCGDPFIVERNPHIHDPDDVFPGLVIKITPTPPKEIINQLIN